MPAKAGIRETGKAKAPVGLLPGRTPAKRAVPLALARGVRRSKRSAGPFCPHGSQQHPVVIFFRPFLHMVIKIRGRKKIFSDFFKITLEMFSILKYICQKEILAEKNYLGCFREVRKFKKYT